jgi:hypothetical protein
MQFNIPQFIDKEDKIVGPFTAKQLGWMFGGGAALLVLWNLLDFSGFFVAAIIVVGIVGAFAFYRPYNQTFLSFLFSLFSFTTKPKFYLWKRVPPKNAFGVKTSRKNSAKKSEEKAPRKKISENKIEEISKILDSY